MLLLNLESLPVVLRLVSHLAFRIFEITSQNTTTGETKTIAKLTKFLIYFTVATNALLIVDCELLKLNWRLGTGSLGLFKFNPVSQIIPVECISISKEIFITLGIDDAAYKCARVCSVMAFIFGALLLVLIIFKQCIFPLPCSQFLMDISSTIIQVSLALVYVIWMSSACNLYVCEFGEGSIYLILAQIFWFSAGCFTRCMRGGRWERRDEIQAEREKKQETKKRKEAEDELAKKTDMIAKKTDELAKKTAELEERERELATRENPDLEQPGL